MPQGRRAASSVHGARRRAPRAGAAALALGLLGAVPASSTPLAEPAVGWLASYLRIDTTNPPGGEADAAAFLHQLIAREGRSQLEITSLVSPRGRVSLLARLPGTTQALEAPLLLLHHSDVVPAGDEDQWTHPPFSGRIADGRIWGRGAIDSKGLGVAHLAALLELARSQPRRSRDVYLLAAADEETGGSQGVGWLLQRHADLFPRDLLVLGEGGANRVNQQQVVWWGIENAQKRPLWLRLRFRGEGGHGSTSGGNPVDKLLRGLARLDELRAAPRLTRPLWEHLRVAAPIASSEHAERFGRDFSSGLAVWNELNEAGLRIRWIPPGYSSVLLDTVQVSSVLAGSGVVNVKPSSAEATLDVRLLPDTDQDRFLQELRRLFDRGLEIEVLLETPELPDPSPDHPDLALLEEVLAATAPVVPVMISGTTDARYFRELGIAAFGFSPFLLEREDTNSIHAHDESIATDVFRRGVATMTRVLVRYTTPPEPGFRPTVPAP
ncbi:MAG: M20/M25/M40 family metallo-hydrolase [Acidobacteria bacterium]|nr:MAG: M20/M25/M40 family metallo-hydrolase [Acidobacteriota bacterium]